MTGRRPGNAGGGSGLPRPVEAAKKMGRRKARRSYLWKRDAKSMGWWCALFVVIALAMTWNGDWIPGGDLLREMRSRQVGMNTKTKGSWEWFESHRRKMGSIIEEYRSRVEEIGLGSSLCVLGAGNLNDLDILELVQRFDSIRLYDIDVDSMNAGLRRQGLERKPALVEPVYVDLFFGFAESLDFDQALLRLGRFLQSESRCSVTISTTIWTQLVVELMLQVDPNKDPTKFIKVLTDLRQLHLSTIIGMTFPAGFGIFVTDLVSSKTLPELDHLAQDSSIDFDGLGKKAVESGNFFHGTSPSMILQTLRRDRTRVRGESITFLGTWVWNLAKKKRYLVNGYAFQVK